MEKRKKTIRTVLIFALIAVLAIAGLFALKKAKSVYNAIMVKLNEIQSDQQEIISQIPAEYTFENNWAQGTPLIAHALGGIDGVDYTNSLEAFEYNYSIGYRVFEVDFEITSDGELVCCHDWADFSEMTGVEASNAEPPDSAEFESAKIYGKYTTLTGRELVELMVKYPDMYIVTDFKIAENWRTKKILSDLVWNAKVVGGDVLDRVAVQIYDEDMLDTVMGVYKFKSVIYTLYNTNDGPDEIVRFCRRSGVKAVTMPVSRVDESFDSALHELGVTTCVFTVNEGSEAANYKASGIDFFYSDYLVPSEM